MRFSILLFILSIALGTTLPNVQAQSEAMQKAALLDHLIELHFRPADQEPIDDRFIDRVIQDVNASKLSFDDKFELRYYLTQIAYVNDINGLPAPTKKGRDNLLTFISEDTLRAIMEPLVLQHFKKEHLPSFLKINESDAENIQLNDRNFLVEELLQYQLKPGARVGEVGAGDGLFGLYLNWMKTDLSLFLNEVSEERVGEIYNSLLLLPEEPKSRIKPVLGTESATLLEGLELDALIMRNAFHHFSDPAAMLESIKRSIQPGGVVYLLEQFKEEDDTKNHCSLLKDRDYIEDLFTENGWVKIREIYLEKQRKHLQQYRIQ